MVQRDNRGILVDTGNSFPGGFSMARQVILPFLRFHGIDHIDLVVLSHLDRDHAGGADQGRVGAEVQCQRRRDDVAQMLIAGVLVGDSATHIGA